MSDSFDNGELNSRPGLPPLGPQRSALTSRIASRRSEVNELSPRPASGDFRINLPEAPPSTVTDYGTPNFEAFSSVPVGTPFGYLVNDALERRPSREYEVCVLFSCVLYRVLVSLNPIIEIEASCVQHAAHAELSPGRATPRGQSGSPGSSERSSPRWGSHTEGMQLPFNHAWHGIAWAGSFIEVCALHHQATLTRMHSHY